MSSDEFSLIDRYFSAIGPDKANTRLGIGDDGAILSLPKGYQLVSSLDTLNEGIHFLPGTAAADIAHKALAVNLSDLAAMAAEPAWFLLSLSLPDIDDNWLNGFSAGLGELARQYDIQLVGGDTCRGHLSISIQVSGLVPNDVFLSRSGAKPGDLILVSGTLGKAALGLAALQQQLELPDELRNSCIDALLHPHPRLELVPFLRQYASAAIDLSDGLLADLGHILKASACGATLLRDTLPVDDWVRHNNAWHYALSAGDDYEICCCVAAEHRTQIDTWNHEHPACELSIIGEIGDGGYKLVNNGQTIDVNEQQGYRHFA